MVRFELFSSSCCRSNWLVSSSCCQNSMFRREGTVVCWKSHPWFLIFPFFSDGNSKIFDTCYGVWWCGGIMETLWQAVGLAGWWTEVSVEWWSVMGERKCINSRTRKARIFRFTSLGWPVEIDGFPNSLVMGFGNESFSVVIRYFIVYVESFVLICIMRVLTPLSSPPPRGVHE